MSEEETTKPLEEQAIEAVNKTIMIGSGYGYQTIREHYAKQVAKEAVKRYAARVRKTVEDRLEYAIQTNADDSIISEIRYFLEILDKAEKEE